MTEKAKQKVKTAKEKAIKHGGWVTGLITMLSYAGEKGYDNFFGNNSTFEKRIEVLEKRQDNFDKDFSWHCKVQESEQKAQVSVNDEIKSTVNQINQNIFLILNK